jgi:hypothetical protein
MIIRSLSGYLIISSLIPIINFHQSPQQNHPIRQWGFTTIVPIDKYGMKNLLSIQSSKNPTIPACHLLHWSAEPEIGHFARRRRDSQWPRAIVVRTDQPTVRQPGPDQPAQKSCPIAKGAENSLNRQRMGIEESVKNVGR